MPVHIPVQYADQPQTIDVEVICTHHEAYIEKACCTTAGSSGMIECGCGGQDSVICPNPRCQGIDDSEVDGLFERLAGEQAEDC